MLEDAAVEFALERLRENAIDRYLWLQDHVRSADLSPDGDFARHFCSFYRVRRSKKAWRPPYFAHMEELRAQSARGDPMPSFGEALRNLANRLPTARSGEPRIEASFTSKLLATLEPERPVLDKLVLDHFELRLPYAYVPERIGATVGIFEKLESALRDELAQEAWREHRARFDRSFPGRDTRNRVTDIKALDLLIWAAREEVDEDDDDAA